MADPRICSIPGCGKKRHVLIGYCGAHYYKWKMHGDPLGGRRGASPGEPLRWIAAHAGYLGGGCLIWPFERTRYGYGNVRHEGKKRPASRVMCIIAHGDPPTAHHEAAHSCGNGHLGCVNPKHLRWATKSENIFDMVRHGTFGAAQEKKSRKLTAASVRNIRALAQSLTRAEIAKQFGVSYRTVSNIITGRRWAWVE